MNNIEAILDKIKQIYKLIVGQADQTTNKLANLLGSDHYAKLCIGIQIVGTLMVVLMVKKFNYEYRELLIQYGVIIILHSLLNNTNDEIYEDAPFKTILFYIIIGILSKQYYFIKLFLDAIGMATFFAILPDTDILIVMIFYNFKYLISNSAKQSNTISTILFIFGFILSMLNNQTNIEIWILFLGQLCQTASELLNHNYHPQDFNKTKSIFYKGTLMLIIGLLNYKTVSLEELNDYKRIHVPHYLLIFIIPCIAFELLTYIKESTNQQPSEQNENLIYGVQFLILIFYDKFSIITFITTILYFIGIGVMYIKKTNNQQIDQ